MADRAQVLISQAFKKAPKFICDACGYNTNIKSRLVDHVNSVHLKINNESGNESEDTSPRPQTRREVIMSPLKLHLRPAVKLKLPWKL